MYPTVRQLATRWPELEHHPEPRTEMRADREPSASAGRERPRRPAGPSRYKLAVRTLALSGLMVATLTWLIMPALARLCHVWLAPSA